MSPLSLKKNYVNREIIDYVRYNADMTAIETAVNKITNSETTGDSGAHNVKSAGITGLLSGAAATVYALLVALKSYIDTVAINFTLDNVADDSMTEAKMAAEMKKQAGGVAAYNDVAKIDMYAVTTNAGNVYSATLTAAPTVGKPFYLKFNADSTDAVSLIINGAAAKDVKKGNGSAFTNAKNNSIYGFVDNGTNFILQGSDSSGDATAADIRAGKTASTNLGDITGTMDLTNKTAANIKTGVTIDGTTGTFTNDADAVAGDMRSGKTCYVNGTKITGTANIISSFTAGDSVLYDTGGVVSWFAELTYTKKKDVTVKIAGVYRITFDMIGSGSNYAYGRLYKNGSAIGTERVNNTASYVEYSEDITLSTNDKIQLYTKNQTGAGGETGYRNFKIKSVLTPLFDVLL